MKTFRFGLMALICLFMASCSSTDPGALVEKIENNPSSLTQSDYTEMINYVDQILSGSDNELEKNLNDLDNPWSTFMMVCVSASSDFGAYPAMDSTNKEKFEKLQQKLQDVTAKFSNMN